MIKKYYFDQILFINQLNFIYPVFVHWLTKSLAPQVNTFFALLCVLWWGALDRLWLRAAQFVRVCSTTGYFNPLRRGWVYRPAPEAPRKGEYRRGPRHFWNYLSRWTSATRQDPPLKRPCATFVRWWGVG